MGKKITKAQYISLAYKEPEHLPVLVQWELLTWWSVTTCDPRLLARSVHMCVEEAPELQCTCLQYPQKEFPSRKEKEKSYVKFAFTAQVPFFFNSAFHSNRLEGRLRQQAE